MPWLFVVLVRFFIATHMSADCVIPAPSNAIACVSVVSDADAAGYGWWVAGLDVDWETDNLAALYQELRAQWNGMKPEERAKLNAEAAVGTKDMSYTEGAPFMGRIPPWTRVIDQAKDALKDPSNVDGLGYVAVLLEQELETQEDGPGNRGYIIDELREVLALVKGSRP
jgi:hypothetical protein